MSTATVLAVFAVVIVVTMSSLRTIAIDENESHARHLLEALGTSATSEVHAAPPVDLKQLTDGDVSLERELNDSHWTGELLFRHGYLVEMVSGGPDGPIFFAWPSHYGRTGTEAFAWNAKHGLQRLEMPPVPFSGLDRRPSAHALTAD